MRSTRLLQGTAILVALLVTATVLLHTPTARAAANAPSWTAGDHWTYTDSAGGSQDIAVVGKESVSLTTGVHEAFHTSWTVSGVVVRDEWIQMADLGIAKVTLPHGGHPTTTYDPPMVQASFPLSPGKAWSGTSDTLSGPSTGRVSFSGTVEAETDASVPAGTFHVFVIRNPSNGSTSMPYSKFYYSDAVGYFVERETYDAQNVKTSDVSLTAFTYQNAPSGVWLIVGAAIAIAVVAVIVVFLVMRKRGAGIRSRAGVSLPAQPPYGAPAYPAQQPPQAPPQPPP